MERWTEMKEGRNRGKAGWWSGKGKGETFLAKVEINSFYSIY